MIDDALYAFSILIRLSLYVVYVQTYTLCCFPATLSNSKLARYDQKRERDVFKQPDKQINIHISGVFEMRPTDFGNQTIFV